MGIKTMKGSRTHDEKWTLPIMYAKKRQRGQRNTGDWKGKGRRDGAKDEMRREGFEKGELRDLCTHGIRLCKRARF